MSIYDNRSPEARLWRKLYSTAKWKTFRRLAMDRDHGLCAMCTRLGVTKAAKVVDHIKEHKGDLELFFNLDNLQCLCTNHHDSAKQSDEFRGYSAEVDENGFPLDRNHPAYKGR